MSIFIIYENATVILFTLMIDALRAGLHGHFHWDYWGLIYGDMMIYLFLIFPIWRFIFTSLIRATAIEAIALYRHGWHYFVDFSRIGGRITLLRADQKVRFSFTLLSPPRTDNIEHYAGMPTASIAASRIDIRIFEEMVRYWREYISMMHAQLSLMEKKRRQLLLPKRVSLLFRLFAKMTLQFTARRCRMIYLLPAQITPRGKYRYEHEHTRIIESCRSCQQARLAATLKISRWSQRMMMFTIFTRN